MTIVEENLMTELLITQQSGHILTITLNQPERRNPISDMGMIDALCAVFEAADRDMSVRCVILTGAGSAFSSGGDLKQMKAGTGGLKSEFPNETRRNYKYGIQRLPLMFQALEVPVVAAVNGPAIGAGLDLATMCDVRIAVKSAKFAESFVKLGIVPGDGGAWLLPRIVGFPKATELALTGETIDASEALRIGLVTQIVDADDLMAAAQAMAAKIAANPPHAVRMTKRLLREGQTAELKNILELSAAMQSLAHATKDNDEAINAFIEKRAPNFTGE
jgi:enoyl-CoA hydratase/carnithine racemase